MIVDETSKRKSGAQAPELNTLWSRVARRSRPLLGVLLGTAFASTVFADALAGLAKYGGNYKYAGTRDEGIAIVDKAVDKSMADSNMVMRLMVKRGIDQHFAETILIELPPGKIGIKIGDLSKVTTEIGKTEEVKGEDGKTGKVTNSFDDSKITQKAAGDDGTIVNTFELDGDGKTLHRSVVVNSQRLSKPLKYKLDYVRK
jgi:hypothetical protein